MWINSSDLVNFFTMYLLFSMYQRKMSAEGYLKQDPQFPTKAIHAGYKAKDESNWNIVPSVTLSSTFLQENPGESNGFIYGRSGNPTRAVLQKSLAALDNAKYGLCFSSGLGTTTAICSLLSAGDNIVALFDIYGGTYRYLSEIVTKMGITTTFVDGCNSENIEKAITKSTKLVWLETPTNPLLKIIDIKKISEIAHKHKDIIVVVDNTFLSPYFQRPLDFGADISMYSITKYINGHSDVVMGAIATNNNSLYERLHFLQKGMGIVPSPFDCYLVNRSLKTLALRMEQHMKNSIIVGKFLESHPQVQGIIHPGLPSHPQHELLKKQCKGYSGMISFYLKGGQAESQIFLSALKMIALAESLGGYETLIGLPCLMSHSSVPPEDRPKLGLTDNLIRISIGLESADDIIADLAQAFDALKAK